MADSVMRAIILRASSVFIFIRFDLINYTYVSIYIYIYVRIDTERRNRQTKGGGKKK